jgi:hypothetical protein
MYNKQVPQHIKKGNTMNFFNFNRTKSQTKMFVSALGYPKTKSIGQHKHSSPLSKGAYSIPKNTLDALVQIAPDLIEEGLKLVSSAIAGFTKDYISTTYLHKNIDGHNSKEIFIPEHITIIRANFEAHVNDEKNNYGDNFGNKTLLYKEIEERKLQIELDIINSDDQKSFYFQPSSYYYIGRDLKGKNIDEINLYFAFVTASENISNYETLEFKKIISFSDLSKKNDYTFKRKDGSYDSTYQSAWISSEEEKNGAYTIVFKIEEKRHSKAFAKTINGIYKKHEEDLEKKINKEIQEVFDKRGKA